VAQYNAIAIKAVNKAGCTNIAVKELEEAAGRIGDVVKLITGIAE
jgi:methyl-accepting chemotaxis protein